MLKSKSVIQLIGKVKPSSTMIIIIHMNRSRTPLNMCFHFTTFLLTKHLMERIKFVNKESTVLCIAYVPKSCMHELSPDIFISLCSAVISVVDQNFC